MASRQEIMQKIKEQNKERNNKYRKLARFLSSKGLRSKEATCFNTRISYFRGENLFEAIIDNSASLLPIIKEYYPNEIKTKEDAENFAKYLLKEHVIVQFDRDEEKKLKWPKKLRITPPQLQEISEKGFYSWNLDLTSKYSSLLMFLVLFLIFGICLFPVWPISAKITIFYVSLVLLYFLLGFIFLRLIWFIVLRIILGVDSWILPNLFAEVSFVESFRPVISFQRSEDGWTEFFARFIAFVILAFMIYKLGQQPEIIKDYSDMGSQTFDDLMEWGRLRIEGKALDEKVIKRGIPNLSDIIDKEEENKTSQEAVKEENNQNSEKEEEQTTDGETEEKAPEGSEEKADQGSERDEEKSEAEVEEEGDDETKKEEI